MIARRGLLTALVGLVAAPAIIKVADLMPINSGLVERSFTIDEFAEHILAKRIAHANDVLARNIAGSVLDGSLRVGDALSFEWEGEGEPRQFVVTSVAPKGLLSSNEITRDSVRLFKNSNEFLRAADRQFSEHFGADGVKIGSQLRIRLPNDYVVSDGPQPHWLDAVTDIRKAKVSPVAAVALGAAAVVASNPVVSRRFWDRKS